MLGVLFSRSLPNPDLFEGLGVFLGRTAVVVGLGATERNPRFIIGDSQCLMRAVLVSTVNPITPT